MQWSALSASCCRFTRMWTAWWVWSTVTVVVWPLTRQALRSNSRASSGRSRRAHSSYPKGGLKETVARVHFRGHVNRHLRGLRATQPLPRHARVQDTSGKDVGDVRSTVISPRLGPIAMAMIRREVEPGSHVMIETPDGVLRAEVLALPFAE